MRNIVIKISNTTDVLSANAFNALNDEMENIVVSSDITLDPNLGPDTNLNMLAQAFASYANAGKTYDDDGTANTYVSEMASDLKVISQLYDGLVSIFKAANANTGASTLDAVALTRPDGTALTTADILEDDYIIAYYNLGDTRFEIVYYRPFASSAQIEAHTLDDRLISPANLKVVEDKFYPIGIIRIGAIGADISGYLECDGASYDTTTQAALFAVIGYTFGGSGSDFNVPTISGGLGTWVDQSAPVENWQNIAVDSSNGDVWACSAPDDNIYKRTGGVGSWVDQSAPGNSWRGIAVNSSNGDVWACDAPGNAVYKRTGGIGSWVDQSAPSAAWQGVTVDSSNGDVWACELSLGKIYKRTGGIGSWVDQSASAFSWSGIAVDASNGDVWACENTTDKIYKRTGGIGSWVDQSAPSLAWRGIAVNSSNGDVWACETDTDKIYRRTGGIGSWVDQSAPSVAWQGVAVDSSSNTVWACESDADNIYRSNAQYTHIIKA